MRLRDCRARAPASAQASERLARRARLSESAMPRFDSAATLFGFRGSTSTALRIKSIASAVLALLHPGDSAAGAARRSATGTCARISRYKRFGLRQLAALVMADGALELRRDRGRCEGRCPIAFPGPMFDHCRCRDRRRKRGLGSRSPESVKCNDSQPLWIMIRADPRCIAPCPPTFPVTSTSTAAISCGSPGCSCATRRSPRTSMQETLLAALSGSGFSGKSSLRTWLTGILKHKIVDAIRRKQREPTVASALRRRRLRARHRGLRRAVQGERGVGREARRLGRSRRGALAGGSSSTSWTYVSKSCRPTPPGCS